MVRSKSYMEAYNTYHITHVHHIVISSGNSISASMPTCRLTIIGGLRLIKLFISICTCARLQQRGIDLSLRMHAVSSLPIFRTKRGHVRHYQLVSACFEYFPPISCHVIYNICTSTGYTCLKLHESYEIYKNR